jgi:hypothetical protein
MEELRLFQIDTSRHTDDLIADTYRDSAFLQEVLKALSNPEARMWPKPLKKALKIPFSEYDYYGIRLAP